MCNNTDESYKHNVEQKTLDKKKKECRAQSSQSLELLETDIKQIPTQVNI